jgi:hypothetical protein
MSIADGGDFTWFLTPKAQLDRRILGEVDFDRDLQAYSARRSYDFSKPPRSLRQMISSRSISLFSGGRSLQASGWKFNEL